MAAVQDDHQRLVMAGFLDKIRSFDICDHTINVRANLWDKGIDLIDFPRGGYDPG
jgi:hypothetical protein